MKKFREFWLTINETQDDGTSRDYVYEQNPKGMFEYHVIEHSAYTELLELAEEMSIHIQKHSGYSMPVKSSRKLVEKFDQFKKQQGDGE